MSKKPERGTWEIQMLMMNLFKFSNGYNVDRWPPGFLRVGGWLVDVLGM